MPKTWRILVKAEIHPQLFCHDGDEHVDDDRHPDLGPHGIFGSSVEGLEVEMLFDPSKE